MTGPASLKDSDFNVSASLPIQRLGDRFESKGGGVVGGGEVSEPDRAGATLAGKLRNEPSGLRVRQVAVGAGDAPLESGVVRTSPEPLHIMVRLQYQQIGCLKRLADRCRLAAQVGAYDDIAATRFNPEADGLCCIMRDREGPHGHPADTQLAAWSLDHLLGQRP